jgi:hypothetical protein
MTKDKLFKPSANLSMILALTSLVSSLSNALRTGKNSKKGWLMIN